jgi:hypothetical protein
MLLAQHLVPGPGLWSLGLQALWSVALSAQSGEDRFGDRQIVLAHAGSIIRFTGIADIMPVDGIIIKLTRIEERWDNEASNDAARTGGCFFCNGNTVPDHLLRMGIHSGECFAHRWRQLFL